MDNLTILRKRMVDKSGSIIGSVRNILIVVIALMMFNCNSKLQEEKSIIFSLTMKLNNREMLCNDDFFYHGYNLKNIIYPDTLLNSLIDMEISGQDIPAFIYDLKNIVVTDSTICYDISSFNTIFDIAINHIQYQDVSNDTCFLFSKGAVTIFGRCILSDLTKSLECRNLVKPPPRCAQVKFCVF